MHCGSRTGPIARSICSGLSLTIPATWFQSINPLLIIIGTPVLIRVWRRRKANETVPHLLRRMAIGCVIASAALLVMVAAAVASGPEGSRVSSLWVFAYFVLLTLGELFVIPVGLTLGRIPRPDPLRVDGDGRLVHREVPRQPARRIHGRLLARDSAVRVLRFGRGIDTCRCGMPLCDGPVLALGPRPVRSGSRAVIAGGAR